MAKGDTNHPNKKISSILLNGLNYVCFSWSRVVSLWIYKKSKLGHINETKKVPSLDDLEFEERQSQTHELVLSWLHNSMESNITETITFSDTVENPWESIKDLYGYQNKVAQMFKLKQKINDCKQEDGSSFTEHLSKIKTLWDELDLYCPPTIDLKTLQARAEQDKIFQLLASLKPEYENIRSQILMGSKIPSLTNICATIQREEIRKATSNESKSITKNLLEASTLMADKKKDVKKEKNKPHKSLLSTNCNTRTLPYLPMDVVVCILSKLPVKTLLRFRCVSKSWLSLVSNTHFVKTHLNESFTNPNIQRQQTLIYTQSPHNGLYVTNLHSGKMMAEEVNMNYILGSKPPSYICVIGCCNGLVCIMTCRFFYIFNPSTREYAKEIPALKSNFPTKKTDTIYGFGYDHTMDDYKLVKGEGFNVLVYSLRRDCWKEVQYFPYSDFPTLSNFGKLLKGALHWLCPNRDRNQPCMIAAFDMVEEKFWELPMPALTDGTLELLGGCLCIKLVHSHEFFIMKEYGSKQSWTKLVITVPYYYMKPLPLLKSDEALLAIDCGKLILYNLTEGTYRDLEFHYTPLHGDGLCSLEIFVESLVSPSLHVNQSQYD